MDEHDPRYFMVTDLARDAANMMLWDRHLMRIAARFQVKIQDLFEDEP